MRESLEALPAALIASALVMIGSFIIIGIFFMPNMLKILNKSVKLNQQNSCDNAEMTTLQTRINECLAGPPKRKAIDLARYAKVTRSAVSAWTTGKVSDISGETAYRVAKFFNVNPEWLQTGKGKKLILEPEVTKSYSICEFESFDNSTPTRSNEVELPFFREIELVEGSGKYEIHANHGCKLRFSSETLQKHGVIASKAACVTVTGTSMEPVLPDGTTVGIDTNSKEIKDGKMYAVDHKGNLRVKLLYRMPGGGIRLSSYNKAEYPDEIITAEDAADITVLGRVFWSSVFW